MLGIKKKAEYGFSHDFVHILALKIRAKAQKTLVFSPQPEGWG
jgi:hypothetical protein